MSNASGELFHRHAGNPIITACDLPYAANTVFNAGAIQVEDETVLLMRVEDRRGISHLTVARSRDGISHWQIDSQPTLLPCPDTYPEEIWGIEDPRITYLEEQHQWAITYTEPNAGTDLGSMQCRAVDKGDHFEVTGMKHFITSAHFCRWHWMALRTDPDAPKHKGISIFIVDHDTPGLSLSPMNTIGREGTTHRTK